MNSSKAAAKTPKLLESLALAAVLMVSFGPAASARPRINPPPPRCPTTPVAAADADPTVAAQVEALESAGYTLKSKTTDQFRYFAMPFPPYEWGVVLETFVHPGFDAADFEPGEKPRRGGRRIKMPPLVLRVGIAAQKGGCYSVSSVTAPN